MAVAVEAGPSPSLAEVRELAREYDLSRCRDLHRRLRDARVGVPEAARAGAGRSFLLESADQGRVGRYSFIGYRPRKVLRWSLGDPGDPYALAAAELAGARAAPLPEPAAVRRRRGRACSPTTWCAPSSRSASRTRTRSGCPTWR